MSDICYFASRIISYGVIIASNPLSGGPKQSYMAHICDMYMVYICCNVSYVFAYMCNVCQYMWTVFHVYINSQISGPESVSLEHDSLWQGMQYITASSPFCPGLGLGLA